MIAVFAIAASFTLCGAGGCLGLNKLAHLVSICIRIYSLGLIVVTVIAVSALQAACRTSGSIHLIPVAIFVAGSIDSILLDDDLATDGAVLTGGLAVSGAIGSNSGGVNNIVLCSAVLVRGNRSIHLGDGGSGHFQDYTLICGNLGSDLSLTIGAVTRGIISPSISQLSDQNTINIVLGRNSIPETKYARRLCISFCSGVIIIIHLFTSCMVIRIGIFCADVEITGDITANIDIVAIFSIRHVSSMVGSSIYLINEIQAVFFSGNTELEAITSSSRFFTSLSIGIIQRIRSVIVNNQEVHACCTISVRVRFGKGNHACASGIQRQIANLKIHLVDNGVTGVSLQASQRSTCLHNCSLFGRIINFKDGILVSAIRSTLRRYIVDRILSNLRQSQLGIFGVIV